MFTFKITKSSNQQIDVLAIKSAIQNGDLILLDSNSQVIASFARGHWIDCVRSSTPESR